MKHKPIKLISVMVICAFAFQGLALLRSFCYSEKICFLLRSSSFGGQVGGQAWGQTRLPSAVGQAKGKVVLTGVRTNPNPLSPSLRLNPTLNYSWRISLRLKSFSLRPRAMVEKEEIKFKALKKENVALYAEELARIDRTRGYGEKEGHWDESRFIDRASQNCLFYDYRD